MGQKGEIAMYERALSQRWPISAAARAKVVARLDELLDSEHDRVAVAAARALISADAVNLDQEKAILENLPRGANGDDSGIIIDADPETAALESALLARLAPDRAGEPHGPGVVLERPAPDAPEAPGNPQH